MANPAAGDCKAPASSETKATAAWLQEKVDRYLDVVAFSPDGELILIGASSLTSTYWRGSGWFLKDATLPADGNFKLTRAHCQAGVSLESGVSSGIFFSNRRLVVGSDLGALLFYEAKDIAKSGDTPKFQFSMQGYTHDHCSAVLNLDILDNENCLISCGQDSVIKVWDLSTLAARRSYSPAHARMVTSVKAQPDSDYTFVSTSLDGTALMWDIRLNKPAQCLYTSDRIGLTAVAWSGPEECVIGAVSGALTVVDSRKLTQPSPPLKIVARPVHRLETCPHDSSIIAVCQDSSQFSVIKCKDGSIATNVYQDNRHEDFVRAVAWHPKKETAVTCSWDSTLLRHSIPISEPMNGV